MADHTKAFDPGQRALKALLAEGEDHDRVLALFLTQHAILHAPVMAGTEAWSP